MKHLGLAGLGLLLASVACGGGGGGGPTEPLPQNPAISSVNPTQGRPGQSVTITGSNLGGAQASVTFNGVAAQINTASATSIVAILPSILAGVATITVTVGNRSGSFSGFTILAPLPVIGSISPNPVRAGEILIISGQNLRGSVGVNLSQATVVLIDGVVVPPISETSSEIQVRVPIQVIPGNHVIRVQVGTEVSNSIPFEVHIFTVTGTYVAQGLVIINSCLDFDIGDPVGTAETREIAMTDSRPTLTGRIGATAVQGTLTSGGAFNMSHTEVVPGAGTITSRVEGSMLATPQGSVGFSGRVSLSASGALVCSYIIDLIGARVSTVATSRVPAAAMMAGRGAEETVREVLKNAMRSFLD